MTRPLLWSGYSTALAEMLAVTQVPTGIPSSQTRPVTPGSESSVTLPHPPGAPQANVAFEDQLSCAQDQGAHPSLGSAPPTFIYRTRWALTAPIRPPATSFSITHPATSHTGTPPGHPHFPVHLQLSSSTYPATPNPLPAPAYHPNQRANVLRTGLGQHPPTTGNCGFTGQGRAPAWGTWHLARKRSASPRNPLPELGGGPAQGGMVTAS